MRMPVVLGRHDSNISWFNALSTVGSKRLLVPLRLDMYGVGCSCLLFLRLSVAGLLVGQDVPQKRCAGGGLYKGLAHREDAIGLVFAQP